VRVYAVVGGIAAGKTTVARRMARRYGGRRLDADRVGHRVLRLARVRRALLAAFGPGILGPDGAIDRRRLGGKVFGRRARLAALDRIVHPEIAARLHARIASLRQQGAKLILLDAALYFEFDGELPVDGVLAVVAPNDVRRERLRADRGLTRREADARLASQPHVDAWARRADVRLRTDCDLRALDVRIDTAWRRLRNRRRRQRKRKGPRT
jgi:dephospho-CoA kinase